MSLPSSPLLTPLSLFFKFFLDIRYEPVGCFRDDLSLPRPLPVLLKNFRWPSQIDWNNLNKTIKACAEIVKDAGFIYFGLQFYGECWSGSRAHSTYYEDGPSKRCVFGVGKGFANFVYRLVYEGKWNAMPTVIFTEYQRPRLRIAFCWPTLSSRINTARRTKVFLLLKWKFSLTNIVKWRKTSAVE